VASVNIAEALGQPPEQISLQVFGQSAAPRFAFETRDADHHFGVLDLGSMADARCQNAWSSPGPNLVYRDGILVGGVSDVATYFADGSPPPLRIHDFVDGRIRRINPDATADDPPAPLPLAAGMERLLKDLQAPRTPRNLYDVTCITFSGGGAGSLQTLPMLPLILFRPADNASRVNAQRYGADLYDAVEVGQPLPADFTARAEAWRVRLRAHDSADQNYRILTFDMGGARTSGLAQPRGVGYVGVRDGIVVWKAMDDAQSNSLGGRLCVAADGRLGRVRPGCSSTGFYRP